MVWFFYTHGVTDFFGFQGTMIMHFVDSIGKNPNVQNHSVYNEQGAAFAACGYAKATGKTAVAYATSGPGALNLISGVADAFYDSAPVIFLTGQVNTTEYSTVTGLRQHAFQQANVVDVVKPITKYCAFLADSDQIPEELFKAWEIANDGRKGPVVLDIPMNVQRAEISEAAIHRTDSLHLPGRAWEFDAQYVIAEIVKAQRPLFILGNGIGKSSKAREAAVKLISKLGIPVVTTLLGKDILDQDSPYNFGVIGAAYGHRCANWIAYRKADLIVSLGASLCRRQVGGNGSNFAPDAKIIRIDIDPVELSRKVHPDDIPIICDVNYAISAMLDTQCESVDRTKWLGICDHIRNKFAAFDLMSSGREPNRCIQTVASLAQEDDVVAVDVGQHMMWVQQSFDVHRNRLVFSGGHGAMGFALPAAIGAYYAIGGKHRVFCLAGDGAFQMNIQELQWIAREQIPICMIVLNNNCLGLIRQQQEDFFDSKFYGALTAGGYTAPDFCAIAAAYGIENYSVEEMADIPFEIREKIGKMPLLLEFHLPVTTVAVPKTYFGQSPLNQRPYVEEQLLQEIKSM